MNKEESEYYDYGDLLDMWQRGDKLAVAEIVRDMNGRDALMFGLQFGLEHANHVQVNQIHILRQLTGSRWKFYAGLHGLAL